MLKEKIKKLAKAYHRDTIAIRRHLHQYPELSYQEEATGQYVSEQLDQLQTMPDADPELIATIRKFREEEIEHRDTGLEHGAEQSPGYPVLSRGIKTATKMAIKLSTRY